MKVIYNQEKIQRYHSLKHTCCPNCFSVNLSDIIHTPSSDNPELSIIYQLCEDCHYIGLEIDIFERIEE